MCPSSPLWQASRLACGRAAYLADCACVDLAGERVRIRGPDRLRHIRPGISAAHAVHGRRLAADRAVLRPPRLARLPAFTGGEPDPYELIVVACCYPQDWRNPLGHVHLLLAVSLLPPILLIVGVVFLVVPGGFMIVGGAVYCAAASFTGYVAMAARRRRPRATSRRPSRLRPIARRPRRSGADIATPIAAALNTDQGGIR